MAPTTTTFKKLLQCFHLPNRPIALRLTSAMAILLVLSADSFSQVPVIDGNPSEWPSILNNSANTKKGFKHDPFNVNGVDDQWTGGSADNDASPASNWHWVKGNSNDKGDIGNAAAVLINGVLYFMGDRSSESGDAQIGFWFFKDNVQPTGTGDRSSPFIGEHSNGDLLIISNFTNGGGNGVPTVYEWKGKTANSPGGPVVIPLAGSDATLTTNSTTQVVPGWTLQVNGTTTGSNITMFNNEIWNFTPKGSTAHIYPSPLFFEGSVNLNAIPGLSQCFQRFLLETRNSQSISASLQDLTANNFTGTVPLVITALSAANTTGPVSLASTPPHYFLSSSVDGVTGNTNYNYQWVQKPTAGGSLSDYTIYNPSFTATTAGEFKWILTATEKVAAGQQGCISNDSIVRVIAAPAGCPTISDLSVCEGGTGTVSITTGEANNAIPANTHYGWHIIGDAHGATITSADTTDVTSVNIHAGTGNFTIQVRVTYDNSSVAARENCTKTVTVHPGPSAFSLTVTQPTLCNSVTSPTITVCNPTAGVYKLKQTGHDTVTVNYTSGALTFSSGVYLGTGGFTIYYTDAFGCVGTPSTCDNIVATCPSSGGVTSRTKPTEIQIAVPGEEPNVIAAPNPFSDKIRFSIRSPYAGQGSLELYNMIGQKVKIIYQGRIETGLQYFEYNVPGAQRSNLIYVFRIGNYKTSGKLLNMK